MQNMGDSKAESGDECSGASALRSGNDGATACVVRARVLKCWFTYSRSAVRLFGHRKCNMQTAERGGRRSVCAPRAPTVRRQLVCLYFIRNMISIN